MKTYLHLSVTEWLQQAKFQLIMLNTINIPFEALHSKYSIWLQF